MSNFSPHYILVVSFSFLPPLSWKLSFTRPPSPLSLLYHPRGDISTITHGEKWTKIVSFWKRKLCFNSLEQTKTIFAQSALCKAIFSRRRERLKTLRFTSAQSHPHHISALYKEYYNKKFYHLSRSTWLIDSGIIAQCTIHWISPSPTLPISVVIHTRDDAARRSSSSIKGVDHFRLADDDTQ